MSGFLTAGGGENERRPPMPNELPLVPRGWGGVAMAPSGAAPRVAVQPPGGSDRGWPWSCSLRSDPVPPATQRCCRGPRSKGYTPRPWRQPRRGAPPHLLEILSTGNCVLRLGKASPAIQTGEPAPHRGAGPALAVAAGRADNRRGIDRRRSRSCRCRRRDQRDVEPTGRSWSVRRTWCGGRGYSPPLERGETPPRRREVAGMLVVVGGQKPYVGELRSRSVIVERARSGRHRHLLGSRASPPRPVEQGDVHQGQGQPRRGDDRLKQREKQAGARGPHRDGTPGSVPHAGLRCAGHAMSRRCGPADVTCACREALGEERGRPPRTSPTPLVARPHRDADAEVRACAIKLAWSAKPWEERAAGRHRSSTRHKAPGGSSGRRYRRRACGPAPPPRGVSEGPGRSPVRCGPTPPALAQHSSRRGWW